MQNDKQPNQTGNWAGGLENPHAIALQMLEQKAMEYKFSRLSEDTDINRAKQEAWGEALFWLREYKARADALSA